MALVKEAVVDKQILIEPTTQAREPQTASLLRVTSVYYDRMPDKRARSAIPVELTLWQGRTKDDQIITQKVRNQMEDPELLLQKLKSCKETFAPFLQADSAGVAKEYIESLDEMGKRRLGNAWDFLIAYERRSGQFKRRQARIPSVIETTLYRI